MKLPSMRRVTLWITGVDYEAVTPGYKTGPYGVRFFLSRAPNWELTFDGLLNTRIVLHGAPNFVYRAVQRVLLGVKWRML